LKGEVDDRLPNFPIGPRCKVLTLEVGGIRSAWGDSHETLVELVKSMPNERGTPQ
jgi:hypothetical protein